MKKIYVPKVMNSWFLLIYLSVDAYLQDTALILKANSKAHWTLETSEAMNSICAIIPSKPLPESCSGLAALNQPTDTKQMSLLIKKNTWVEKEKIWNSLLL